MAEMRVDTAAHSGKRHDCAAVARVKTQLSVSSGYQRRHYCWALATLCRTNNIRVHGVNFVYYILWCNGVS